MNDEQILALKELGNFKLNDINSQLRKISLLETAYYERRTCYSKSHSEVPRIFKSTVLIRSFWKMDYFLNLEFTRGPP